MLINPEDITDLNDDITNWAHKTNADIKANIAGLKIKHYPYSPNPFPLAQALRNALYKKNDLINRISFKFPRSAVFVSKGVSRGHPITDPRTAKDWFNAVVDKNIDSLGEIVANGQGNLIINNIDIK